MVAPTEDEVGQGAVYSTQGSKERVAFGVEDERFKEKFRKAGSPKLGEMRGL